MMYKHVTYGLELGMLAHNHRFQLFELLSVKKMETTMSWPKGVISIPALLSESERKPVGFLFPNLILSQDLYSKDIFYVCSEISPSAFNTFNIKL